MADGETGEITEVTAARNMAGEAIEFLTAQRSGTMLVDYGDYLAELAQAVRETGKKGVLSLVVTIEPAARNAGGQIKIEDKIIIKKPTPDVAETLMYVGPDGKISRRDPRQPSLPLE